MKAIHKDLFREIKYSLSRFISIVLIVALGVAFYAGIRATGPDMRKTADLLYDEQNLMDIRLLSTWGVKEEDIEEVRALDIVSDVEPAYSKMVYGSVSDTAYIVRVMSNLENLNQMHLVEGRMPENEKECVIDEKMTFHDEMRIGKTLHLESGDEEALSEDLKYCDYEIVGVVNSGYYMSRNRDAANFGNGAMDGYVIISKECFLMDVYTECYVTVSGAKELVSGSEEYKALVEAAMDQIEPLFEGAVSARYEDTMDDARDKITENEEKLADAKEEIKDGEEELADAKEKIEDGEKKLKDGKDTLAKEENKAKVSFAEAKDKLNQAKKQINEGEKKLKKGKKEYEAAKKEAADSKKQLDLYDQKIKENESALDSKRKELEAMKPYMPADMYEEQNQILLGAEKELASAKTDYQSKKKQYDQGITQLNAAKKEMDKNEKELSVAKKELRSGENRYEKEKASADAKIKDAKEEIKKQEDKLKDARADYQEGVVKLKDAKQEVKDAEAELSDAKEELQSVEEPKMYCLDRDSLEGCVEFSQDSDRIINIGKVFPAIFFIVAALVSLTTMTRMVETDRTAIGTLKALGYNKGSVAGKYVWYALLASLIGSLIGMVLGQKILPPVIVDAYSMMYDHLPKTVSPLNINYSISSAFLAIATTVGATMFACYKELFSVPAVLMRPVTPKSGKKVFLEHIPVIWDKISFAHKVTIRNLFRYKKRFFMTIFGIGGCMALLVVGFGLQDSIVAIVKNQYDDVMVYDVEIEKAKDLSSEKALALTEAFDSDEQIVSYTELHYKSLEVSVNDIKKTASIIVPEDPDALSSYIILKNRESKESYALSDEGVIISEKLSLLLSVKEGDVITLIDEEAGNHDVKVLGIAENYLHHYVYMTKELYEKIYHEDPEMNYYFMNTVELEEGERDAFSEKYLMLDEVESLTMAKTNKEKVIGILDGMDKVIWVLIVAAGLLAFVVLYNLNNINITERRRELATIKVLGFYHMEVSMYVYRENIVLTVLGAMLGFFLGKILHRFVILSAELDLMMFGRNISTKSYLYSFLLTILFAAIVNVVLYYKLKKIDMVESLKSVE